MQWATKKMGTGQADWLPVWFHDLLLSIWHVMPKNNQTATLVFI